LVISTNNRLFVIRERRDATLDDVSEIRISGCRRCQALNLVLDRPQDVARFLSVNNDVIEHCAREPLLQAHASWRPIETRDPIVAEQAPKCNSSHTKFKRNASSTR
jgi:hypothetical protein